MDTGMRRSMKTVSEKRQVALGAMVNPLQEAFVQLFSAKHLRNLLLVILVGSGLLVYGQGTSASLTGNVTDPSGAAVPGATVTVTNIGTNLTQSVKTDSVGTYLLRPLPIGNYTLTIEAAGFARYVQKGSPFSIGQWDTDPGVGMWRCV